MNREPLTWRSCLGLTAARRATVAPPALVGVIIAALLIQRDFLDDQRQTLIPVLWGSVAVAALVVWLLAEPLVSPRSQPVAYLPPVSPPTDGRPFGWALACALSILVAGLALLECDPLSQLGGWLWLAGLTAGVGAFVVRESRWPRRRGCARATVSQLGRFAWAGSLLAIALGLRLYRLETIPAMFLQDEGAVADWGLSVLHGTPLWGQRVVSPVGLFRPGVAAYTVLGSYLHAWVMQLAGETIWGLRLTAAVCGGITVWFLYLLLAREVRGWVATATSLLFAVSHVHLFWSRSGMLQSMNTMVATLLMWVTLRGLRSGRFLDFVVSGLCLGAAQYLYEGSRFLVPIIGLFFVYMAMAQRGFCQRRWLHVVVMALASIAVVAPLGAWYLQHPRDLFALADTRMIFLMPDYLSSRYPGLSNVGIILAQLRRSLLGLASFGDGSAAFYAVGMPLVDPVVGALVLTGVLGFTLRPQQPADVLVALWLWVPIAIACTITNEPPPMTRLILALPALFFVVGMTLDRVTSIVAAAAERWGVARLMPALVAVALGYATLWNLHVFFVEYPSRVPANMWTEAGNLAHAMGSSSKTYMVSPMHLYFSSPEMRFLARGLAGDDLRVDQIPVREQGHRDGLFLVAPALPEALARLRAVYPHGQLREHRDLHSALLFTSYRVSAADLNAAAGYDAPWRQYDLSFGMGGSRFGQFQNGRGLAVDPLGRTYIADTGNGRIDVFDPAGKPIETVGKRGDGDAEFHTVWSVAVAPDGTVLGLDRETCWLKRFTPAGRWLGNFGGPALLQQPSGVAVGADGTVFVADSARHVIMRFDLHGQLLGPLGSRGSGPGEFEEPSAVAVAADGTVYVADAGNGRVQRFSQTLEYVAEWAAPRAQPDLGPALAVANDDSAAVYLVNPARVTVDRYSSGGRREWSVGEQGNAPGQLALPVAVAVDAHGSVYVLDNFRNQVYRFDVTRRPR